MKRGAGWKRGTARAARSSAAGDKTEAEKGEQRGAVGENTRKCTVLVREIANAVAVGIIAGVVAPEVATPGFGPGDVLERPTALRCCLLEIFQERIAGDEIGVGRRADEEANVVIGDPITCDVVDDSLRDRGIIDVESDTVAQHEVCFSNDAVRFFDG